MPRDKMNDQILKKINRDRSKVASNMFWILVAIVSGVFLIFAAFYSYFSYTPVSEADLLTITGTLEKWSYEKVGKSYEMHIKLDEYPVTFNVWSVPLSSFDKDKFEKSERGGDNIRLYILRENADELRDSKGYVNVYGVLSNKNTYLSLNQVNKEESSNAKLGLILGCIFIISVIFLVIVLVNAYKNKS